ncbi:MULTISPECIES: hypothetical protein [unclassified Gilliamella]|uniref:hypothetical protein n=1 Tax=unclassified Gilliamella TaxID=2685620 RepID=UPI0013237F06|nr:MULTISPECIES: hypothetical protein [unclassified Gilliamella]MWN32310.1 hypothetical protein [Gilliamella sp. Pra-s60]MWP29532.1 hypothetical protein [Gilliamella sp. Pra-s54]
MIYNIFLIIRVTWIISVAGFLIFFPFTKYSLYSSAIAFIVSFIHTFITISIIVFLFKKIKNSIENKKLKNITTTNANANANVTASSSNSQIIQNQVKVNKPKLEDD